MHIAFLIANEDSVPYFTWFAEKARDIPDLRFTFIALYHKRPRMVDEMLAMGHNCIWIPFDPARRKSGMVRALFQLMGLFRRLRPDVVHTHLFDDSVPGLLAAALAGVKVRVITKQDTGFHYYFKPIWVPFDMINNAVATHIHAVASENRRFIVEKELARPSKVHLIRNGFPVERMSAADDKTIATLRSKFGLEGQFVIGTVARFIEWKGHHLIIEAARSLLRDYPDLRFVWAGTSDDPYARRLLELARGYGIEAHFVMTGWIERRDMPSFYRCLDIYLHPAVNEPFGFAISEAMMNGVAAISTRTGSTDGAAHLEHAYILRENSIDDIVDGVGLLRRDPPLRARIAEAGRARATAQLAFERMWDEHIQLYRSAVASDAPR